VGVLAGKTVLLGVTGGIAAYKSAELVRWLKGEGAAVVVVMTSAARRFVSPLTLETLSGNPVVSSLWAPVRALDLGPRPADRRSAVEHIEIADAIHLALVAPATADFLARLAHGFAGDALTATLLATRAPLVVAPAMNVNMWRHAATQENVARLRARGVRIVEPESGELACGWEGEGRLAALEAIGRALLHVSEQTGAALAADLLGPSASDGRTPTIGPLAGRRVLVTAGPTREAIDPVRYLSNHSSGRMGYALAEEARDLGAAVTLVSGPTSLTAPTAVEIVPVTTAAEMDRAVRRIVPGMDAVVMAAAVADFRPARAARSKIRRADAGLALQLSPTPDILKEMPRHRGLVVVGFALETEGGMERARAKLREKRCDLVALNDPTRADSAFGGETNRVTIVDRDGGAEKLPTLTKRQVAARLWERVAALWPARPATKRRATRRATPPARRAR
jgi:phosphopantothenoylcysteine decarboxylase/phosphopantothenate--cysteine ligase